MVRKRTLIVAVMLLALAGLVWFEFTTHTGNARRHDGKHNPGAVPVLTATATRKNVPVILQGVGTVQAYQTVTVQPQVSGKLLQLDFKEGQQVKKGQILAQIDPVTYKAQLEQAKARLAMDRAALANARLDLKRYAKLARTNYVSKQKADQARATVRQDEAQVQSDQAAVDSAKATLSYTSIVAPISGRTGLRMVDQGNIVTPSDTKGIVVITQLHPIAVVFTLPAADIDPVRAAAAKSTLPVRVLGADSGKVLDHGQLEVINNQVDPATGTIKLKAVMPNVKQQLWPGQFVNAELQVGTIDNATVVPAAAVQQGPDGAFVYRLGQDDTARMQAVQVTQQSETEAVIAQGVTPGERVITAGFGQLTDGTKVKPDNADSKASQAHDGEPTAELDAATEPNRTTSADTRAHTPRQHKASAEP